MCVCQIRQRVWYSHIADCHSVSWDAAVSDCWQNRAEVHLLTVNLYLVIRSAQSVVHGNHASWAITKLAAACCKLKGLTVLVSLVRLSSAWSASAYVRAISVVSITQLRDSSFTQWLPLATAVVVRTSGLRPDRHVSNTRKGRSPRGHQSSAVS